MSGIHDFGTVLLAAILLNLTPGQDTLFVLGRSLAGGRGAGIASALGIGVGSLLHTLAAGLGLSALLAASPTAFRALELLGAAYLIWLGARLVLARPVAGAGIAAADAGGSALALRQGILTNLANPKVALFFLAFLPQFVDPRAGQALAAFLLLGCTFVATGTAWCLVLALGAARLRARVATGAGAALWLPRVAGALFVALGLRLLAGAS
jgi:threonine/homoserine/homoserine lactone efflux protein